MLPFLVLLAGCTVHGYHPVSAMMELPPHSFTSRPLVCPYTEIAIFHIEGWTEQRVANDMTAFVQKEGGEGIIDFAIHGKAVQIEANKCNELDIPCEGGSSDPLRFTTVYVGTGSVVRWRCPDGSKP
jgi:hypothetical protein